MPRETSVIKLRGREICYNLLARGNKWNEHGKNLTRNMYSSMQGKLASSLVSRSTADHRDKTLLTLSHCNIYCNY